MFRREKVEFIFKNYDRREKNFTRFLMWIYPRLRILIFKNNPTIKAIAVFRNVNVKIIIYIYIIFY